VDMSGQPGPRRFRSRRRHRPRMGDIVPKQSQLGFSSSVGLSECRRLRNPSIQSPRGRRYALPKGTTANARSSGGPNVAVSTRYSPRVRQPSVLSGSQPDCANPDLGAWSGAAPCWSLRFTNLSDRFIDPLELLRCRVRPGNVQRVERRPITNHHKTIQGCFPDFSVAIS